MGDNLQTLLQLHLATDDAAAHNLPTAVTLLSSGDLDSSPHLTKWLSRINALIHSKETGVRWAGIVLALKTSKLSRNVVLISAQSWMTIILPMLSRNESLIVWKAGIRLLASIFLTTTNLPEFRRTVVAPNVAKYSAALISILDKTPENELRVLCLDTLTQIVPLYPTLHRQLANKLSSTSLNLLNGSPVGTSASVISSASKLHACLHTTGGKVGSAGLWRKSVDDTISFCFTAAAALRTTSRSEGKAYNPYTDPIVDIYLNVDRLQCGITLLRCLLCSTVPRPVLVPVQTLMRLCIELIKVTGKSDSGSDVDIHQHNMENSTLPQILELGCTLLKCVSMCIKEKIAPYMAKLLNIIAYQLEQPTPMLFRLPFIKLLPSLLSSALPPSEPLLAGRLIKAILPGLTPLLSERSITDDQIRVSSSSKKGKKRMQGYEGDELFKVGRDVIFDTEIGCEATLAALDALRCLLQVPNIPVYLRSLSLRLLLSILLALQNLSALSVSRDLTVKDGILNRVKSCCIDSVGDSSSVLCKSLPLVVNTITKDNSALVAYNVYSNAQLIDLMIHPRLPPLLRSLPTLDSIALCWSNESKDERETREKLGLSNKEDVPISHESKTREIQMKDAPMAINEQQRMPINATQEAGKITPAVVSFAPQFNSTRQTVPALQPEPMGTSSESIHTHLTPLVRSFEPSQNKEVITQKVTVSLTDVGPVPAAEIRKTPQIVQETGTSTSQYDENKIQSGGRVYANEDEDDEDIEMPELNLESDTDSE